MRWLSKLQSLLASSLCELKKNHSDHSCTYFLSNSKSYFLNISLLGVNCRSSRRLILCLVELHGMLRTILLWWKSNRQLLSICSYILIGVQTLCQRTGVLNGKFSSSVLFGRYARQQHSLSKTGERERWMGYPSQ